MFLETTLAGYALLALVFILDKILVSRSGSKMHPFVIAFYSSLPLGLLFIAGAFGVNLSVSFSAWLVALVSGASLVGALIFLYSGFAQSEVSHNGPIVGIFTTLATIAIAATFLHEVLGVSAYIGMALLLVGSALVSFEESREHMGWHRGTFFAALSGICFAISNATAKWLYGDIGFQSGFILSYGTAGVAALFLLFHPAVRQAIANGFNRSATGHVTNGFLVLIVADKVLGLAGSGIIHYAISLGSVSVVSALQAFQYALIVLLAALISRSKPGIFFEEYRRGELAREMAGVVFVTAGLFVLAMV